MTRRTGFDKPVRLDATKIDLSPLLQPQRQRQQQHNHLEARETCPQIFAIDSGRQTQNYLSIS
jgi:hypothetical protein